MLPRSRVTFAQPGCPIVQLGPMGELGYIFLDKPQISKGNADCGRDYATADCFAWRAAITIMARQSVASLLSAIEFKVENSRIY